MALGLELERLFGICEKQCNQLGKKPFWVLNTSHSYIDILYLLIQHATSLSERKDKKPCNLTRVSV